MKVFLDSEFTGLHQGSTLISLGMIADNGKTFYAEFNDYDESQVDDWVRENVIAHLQFADEDDNDFYSVLGDYTMMKGDSSKIAVAVELWLKQFKKVELWSDCHHYDIVLFMELFGGAMNIPNNMYYIPFDISTMFKVLGIDPDVSREAFIDTPIEGVKHSSLYDAKVIQACYDKLRRNKFRYPLDL